MGPGSEQNSKHSLGTAFQVCIVVPDVEEAMEAWWKRYGVGPWKVWDLGPHNLVDQQIDEKPAPFSFRCAITQWGVMELELIEPLDDQNIYAQSLADHGNKAHLHHLHCWVDDYDDALAEFRALGHHPTMSGGLHGNARFSYVSTDTELGAIIEIHDWPNGWEPPTPDLIYPEPQTSDI